MTREYQEIKAPYNFSEPLSILNQQCPGTREGVTIEQYLKAEQVRPNPALIKYFKENPKFAYAVMQDAEISCKIRASHSRFYDSFQETKKKITREIFVNYLPLNLSLFIYLGITVGLILTVGMTTAASIYLGTLAVLAVGLACAMVYDYRKNVKSALEITHLTGLSHVIQDIAHQYENTIIKPNTCSKFLNFFKKSKPILNLEESNSSFLKEGFNPR